MAQSPESSSGASDAAALPPAYFLSLSLENVRCFGPEQTLDLSDGDGDWAQWTVILGDNGTGKTTLLQSIATAKHDVYAEGQDPQDSAKTGREREEVKVRPHAIAFPLTKEDSIVGKGVTRAGNQQSSFRFKYVSPGLEPRRMKFSFTHSLFKISGENKLGKDGVITAFAYGSSRTTEASGFQEKKEAETLGLFDDNFVLPNAHDWLLQTDYAAKRGKEEAAGRLDQILKVLAHILPDVGDIQIKEQEGNTALPKVEFHTPYGWVTMDQLSLGYRTMISWIVDLARRLFERYPEMDNPLEGAAVCLVDEIDLHLHPTWQRKIIGFLGERFPNTQFIVTAHSPLIVQAAQDANIAVLKRSDEPDETGAHYVEIHNDLEPLRNLRVDQILTSDLYGLDSARPPQMDKWMDERDEILAKSELTLEDIKELERLSERIGDLPTGETPDDIEAMNLIRRAAKRLQNQ